MRRIRGGFEDIDDNVEWWIRRLIRWLEDLGASNSRGHWNDLSTREIAFS